MGAAAAEAPIDDDDAAAEIEDAVAAEIVAAGAVSRKDAADEDGANVAAVDWAPKVAAAAATGDL